MIRCTEERERLTMKEHTGIAFAPGHLTAFFRTADSSSDPRMQGSLGSGICLSQGACTRIRVGARSSRLPGDHDVPGGSGRTPVGAGRETEIIINGVPREAHVTRSALDRMLEDARTRGWMPGHRGMHVLAETTLQLPERSGWGMSGAGALSAALALRDALNLPYSRFETAAFAHMAELDHTTGLGDVAAQVAGGVDIRKRPGIQPYGLVDRIPVAEGTVVCLTLPEPLSTASVLMDPGKRGAIDTSGEASVEAIISHPTMDMFFQLARGFTLGIGLAHPRITSLLDSLGNLVEGGGAGMAMLGNSLFAMGDTPALAELFRPHGRVDVCRIDLAGARVLPARTPLPEPPGS